MEQKMSNVVSKKQFPKLSTEKLPRAISSDKEHSQIMHTVTDLMMRHLTLNPKEDKLLRSLVKLVAGYEDSRFSMLRGPVKPLSMLEHMMDAHGHTAKDLAYNWR